MSDVLELEVHAEREVPRAQSHSGGQPLAFSLEPLSQHDPEQVTVVPVQPVDELFGQFGGRCLALRNLMTEQECQYLISEMSAQGNLERVQYRHDYRRNDRCIFESQELASLLWERVRPIASALAIHADPAVQAQQKLVDERDSGSGDEKASWACPEELQLGYGKGGLWRPTGLNECLRFCRYTPGGFFRPHCDGCFQRSEEERSLFTCMFYLDGGMEGGSTRFLRPDSQLTQENYLKQADDRLVLASIQPEPGLCLLFFQPGLLHEGEELRQGVKHLLRTDVMFHREPGTGLQRTPQEEEAWRLLQAAQAAEAASECDAAWKLYRRAFKLDPKLERVC